MLCSLSKMNPLTTTQVSNSQEIALNKSTLPNLQSIAEKLESLEETIIYKLIDRAQFAHNPAAYAPGSSGFSGESNKSLFELRLFHQESMDAQFGRFYVPEERPFSKDLPQTRRSVNLPDTGLAKIDYETVNLCDRIQTAYLKLLADICPQGDDEQYGSSVEHDVYALQAIARRIHYGALYVAESKFSTSPGEYGSLIKAGDTSALMGLLTRAEVEEKIIDRVRNKVAFIQEQVNPDLRNLVDPNNVLSFYREVIIPLTKDGEIAYLLNRPLED